MNIGPHALAKLYRGILDESLDAARDSVAVVDRAAEFAINVAFGSAIPSMVPAYLAGKTAGPELEAALRSDAAELLFRVCRSLPPSDVVAAVANAAKARA